jgi:hypothetical protein
MSGAVTMSALGRTKMVKNKMTHSRYKPSINEFLPVSSLYKVKERYFPNSHRCSLLYPFKRESFNEWNGKSVSVGWGPKERFDRYRQPAQVQFSYLR